MLGALVAVVAATVGVIYGVVIPNRLDSNMERIGDPFEALPTRPPLPEAQAAEVPDNRPLNILVLGSDSRISAGDPTQWQRGAQRTDAIMLVHLSADRASAQVMSIPRDSWVEIPGYGEAKINAAYSYGGPSLLIQTVEQLTGVRIDHFALTDFESFTRITDALGGVRLVLRDDLVVNGRLIAPAGEQILDGDQALAYVRQRYGLRRGDFDRVQRQQAWMRAMFARMRNEQTLQNPVTSVPFLDAVTRSVAVDDGLTREVMYDLLDRAKDLGSTDISFFTVPIQGTGRSADGQSIVVLDRPSFDALMAAVREDRVPAFLAEQPDVVDVLPPVAP